MVRIAGRLLLALSETAGGRSGTYRDMGTAAFTVFERKQTGAALNLQLSGKLNSYLADIDRQAENMFELLVKQMAERESVTEQLKSTDQMAWVTKMNNIRNRATEIVNANIVFM